MADADEDRIPLSQAPDADDLEDAPQDFRFLAQLTSQSTLPKRGTKDFEPNPTRAQARSLDDSRRAMHDALSAVRVHSGKNHLVARYVDDQTEWRWDAGVDGGARRNGRCVVCRRFKSTHLKTMGMSDSRNWTWFLPEEALWLLERGSLDIRWPDAEGEGRDEGEGDEQGDETGAQSGDAPGDLEAVTDEEPQVGALPMSLQGAYAAFIGKDGLTLERYQVYAALKRIGYIVSRAPTWHDGDENAPVDGHAERPATSQAPAVDAVSAAPTSSSPLSAAASLIHRLCSFLFAPRRGDSCPALGPFVAPGLYRNYADVFRALAMVPYYDPATLAYACPFPAPSSSPPGLPSLPPTQPAPSPDTPFRVTFHVHKPLASSTYRKTAPPPPDYRVVVVSARDTAVPTLAQAGALLDAQPWDSSRGGLEARVRHGRRNVILAVVDSGIVSYLRWADAGFGAEKLFLEKTSRGTKGARRGGKGKPTQAATGGAGSGSTGAR